MHLETFIILKELEELRTKSQKTRADYIKIDSNETIVLEK